MIKINLIIVLFFSANILFAQINTNPAPSIDSFSVQGGQQPAQNSTGVNVNTFSGDASAIATDFNYSRNGFPLKFERYFQNGITSPVSEMGPGWMSNYDICIIFSDLNDTGGNATLVLPNQSWTFTPSGDGINYTAPPGCFYKLQNLSGVYTLTDKYGIVYKFQQLDQVSLAESSFINNLANFFSSSVGSVASPNLASLVEIDDLNGNIVTLNYEEYVTYYQVVNAFYFFLFFPYDSEVQGFIDTDARLASVSGPLNNWKINFQYYDTNFDPLNNQSTTSSSSGWYSEIDNTYSQLNAFGNRLKQVTDTMSDATGNSVVTDQINFDTGGQSGPITQVSRTPSKLNANYTYYNYISNVINPSTNQPVPVVTLNQVADQLAPAGQRNITYVSQSNPSSLHNPVQQIRNATGQVMYNYNYTVDGAGNSLTSTSGPNGLIETDVYSPAGIWLQKKFLLDGHPYTENYTFGSNFLPMKIINGNGDETDFGYDGLGNLNYEKDGEQNESFATYDNFSRITYSKDKNKVIRNYTYYHTVDSANEFLYQVTEAGILTHTYTYVAGTSVQSMTSIDANTHSTTTDYDANGYPSAIRATDVPEEGLFNITTTYQYDARGNLNYVINPLGEKTTYTYDSNQKWLDEINYPDNTNEQFEYDPNGNKSLFIDRKSTQTKYVYDGNEHLTDMYTAFGVSGTRHTGYQYDTLGNQTAVVDGNTHKTSYIYNEQNLVRSTQDAVGKGYSATYDGARNLLLEKDTRGITKTLNYFKNNRLMSIQFSDGTPSISYTYDGNGNRASMTDGTGTKTYRYDSFNRLINNMDMVRNFSISYSYDNMGNRLTEQNNKISGTVNYGYYENNQLESITDVDGMATTYVYDALQNAKNTYLANGASVTYAFDYANHTDRLLSLQTNNSHGEVLSTFSYGYDAVGNVENITDLTGKTSYNYDNLYQLTNAAYPGPQGPVSYVYDNAGNRTSLIKNGTSQNCGYDAGNEITAGYGNSFSYDGSGNMTQRTASGAVTTYSWDALNRMVIVKTPSGSITYVYDGNNHRVQKNTSQSKTNYYFDGNNVVAETDANNSLQKSYLPAISYKDKQGNKFFYIYNGHGDVAGLLDLKQSLVQSYSYDAFGAPLGVQKDSNNYRYVGSGGVYSDDDSDLEYMWNRMYDPQLGRFINRDSIGSSGGTNLYCYCANNPLKYTDTNGKAFLWDDIAAIVIGAVNGLIDGLNNGYSPGLVVLDALGNAGIADFALNAVYIGGWADPAALAGQFAFTNFLGLLHNTIDTTGPRYGSGQVLGSFFSVLGGKLFTDSIGPVITDVLNDTKAFSSPFAQAVFQNSLKNILGDVYGLVDTATGESDHLADQIIKSFSPTYNQGDLTDPNLNGSSGAG